MALTGSVATSRGASWTTRLQLDLNVFYRVGFTLERTLDR
jgi:hypothetical protein